MPAINITGGGAGGGSGLEAAIAALTAAVNRNTAAQGGGGGGGSGGGVPPPGGAGGRRGPTIFGSRADRANANTMNADFNARDRYQRRIYELSDRAFSKNQKDNLKAFTDNENAKYRVQQTSLRKQEREEQSAWRKKEREDQSAIRKKEREDQTATRRATAFWIADGNARYRTKQAQQRKEEREAKAAAAKLRKADEDENRYLTANHNQIWRIQQAALKRASVSPRAGRTPEEIRAAFDYRTMRADADHMNRQHGRDQRPEPRGAGGSGGKGGGRFGAWSNPDSTMGKRLSPSGLGDLRRGLMNNTVAGTVIMGTIATVSTPMIMAAISSQIMRLAEPYFDLQRDTMAMGRAGGFNSPDLLNALYAGKDGKTPDWMKQYGYTPEGAAGTLRGLGLNRGAQGSVDILKSLGAAEYMPGMSLSREQLAGGFKQATTLGMLDPDSEKSRQDYWQRLQKTMITAQTYSLDHADSQRNIQALLAQAAAAGAGAGTGASIMAAWERGVSSGLPGARSGEITAQGLAGMDAMSRNAGPGGEAGVGMDMQLFFSKPENGGHMPGTEEELRRHFDRNGNKGAFDTYMATGAGRSTVQDYLGAMKAGNVRMAQGFLGEMHSGRPDLQFDIARGGRAGYLPDYARTSGVAGAAGGGIPFTRSQGGGEVTLLPATGATLGARGNNWTNLDYRTDQGAMGYQTSGKHQFGVYATPEAGVAAGLRQVLIDQDSYKLMTLRQLITKRSPPNENKTTQLVADIAKSAGVDPDTPLNMRDPELAKRVMTAMSIHESGMGRTPEQQAIVARGVAMGLGANVPTGPNAAVANNGQLGMTGAAQMSTFALNLGGGIGDGMLSFSSSIMRATEAVEAFIKKIGDWTGPSTSGPHANPTGISANPPITQGVGQYPPRRAYPDMSGMGSGDPSTM